MIELQIGDRVQMGEGCGWNREGMFGTVFTIGPVVGFVDDRDLYGIRFEDGFEFFCGLDDLLIVEATR